MLRRKKASFKSINKGQKIFVLTIFLFAVSLVSRLYFAGKFAAENVALSKIYTERLQLSQELSALKYEDSLISSLAYIEQRAQTLGYVKMKGMLLSLDVTVSPPLALR